MANELPHEKIDLDGLPVRIVHPFSERVRGTVVFYHGWSSTAALQLSRAALFAAYGYRVILPEGVHHGERGALPDYYTVPAYDDFWDTIFRNLEEFKKISAYLAEKGYGRPWVAGHSMGGITAMGLAAHYPKEICGAVSFNGSGDWLLTHLFIEARFGVLISRDWPLYDKVAAASPIAHLAEMKDVPVFMTNGEADPSVDPRAQEHFAEELARAGGRGTRITYPGLAHFVTTNMIDDALAWMEKNS